MTIDYYQRRMVINRFKNRPPFDLKKKDDQAINERKAFILHSRKTLENLEKTYMQHFDIDTDNKNKSVIPKIIDSFQKVTPSQEVERISNTNASVHTLYRYKKAQYGKSITNHRLMSNLLNNLNENRIYKTSVHDGVDMIPSKEVNPTFTVEVTSKGNNENRVDKKTSTTGLDDHYVPKRMTCWGKSNKNIKSRIPQLKKTSSDQICKKNSSSDNNNCPTMPSSEVDMYPSKDQSLSEQRCRKESKIPVPPLIPKMNEKQKTFILEKEHIMEKRCKNRGTEKSFVGKQVDRYNKLGFRHAQKRIKSAKVPPKKPTRDINSSYIDIMSSIRENYPKLLSSTLDNSNSDNNHEWSDHTVSTRPDVSFPRETRDAMEKLINEARTCRGEMMRKPLNKFIKNHQHIDLHPAISLNYTDCESRGYYCNK